VGAEVFLETADRQWCSPYISEFDFVDQFGLLLFAGDGVCISTTSSR
jgi:hypothetical protein